MSTLYDDLEVSSKASFGTIRAAYKALIQRYHPDKNPSNREAALRTQRLNNAYEILSDADKRAAYDAQLGAEDRLNRERDEERRRTASESAARAAVAEAELRREMETRRAESAAMTAAESEQERRRNSRDEEDRQAAHARAAIAARKLQTARAKQPKPTQVPPSPPPRPAASAPRSASPKPAAKPLGFLHGLARLVVWGFAFWIGLTVLFAYTEGRWTTGATHQTPTSAAAVTPSPPSPLTVPEELEAFDSCAQHLRRNDYDSFDTCYDHTAQMILSQTSRRAPTAAEQRRAANVAAKCAGYATNDRAQYQALAACYRRALR
jgi:curved DNA-binding protein CbpA